MWRAGCLHGGCTVTAGKGRSEWLILPSFSPFPGAIPHGLNGSDAPPSADTPVLHDFGTSMPSRAELLLLARPLSVCFTGIAPLILTPALEAGAAVTLVLQKRKLGQGVARKSRAAKCHYSYLRHQAPGAQPLTTTPHCPMATYVHKLPMCWWGDPCISACPAPTRAYGPWGWSAKVSGEHRMVCVRKGGRGRGGSPVFPGGWGILARRPPRALRCWPSPCAHYPRMSLQGIGESLKV